MYCTNYESSRHVHIFILLKKSFSSSLHNIMYKHCKVFSGIWGDTVFRSAEQKSSLLTASLASSRFHYSPCIFLVGDISTNLYTSPKLRSWDTVQPGVILSHVFKIFSFGLPTEKHLSFYSADNFLLGRMGEPISAVYRCVHKTPKRMR